MANADLRPAPRPLTGRHVLVMILSFFGIIIGVNIVMARFAVTTFGGLETASSYKAGLAFKGEEIAAAAQSARDWTVSVAVTSLGENARTFTMQAQDASGAPLTGYAASARIVHPTDARQDMTLALSDLGGGRYRGEAAVHPGQWDLVVDLAQGDARLFRSKNRIII
eukprot:gene9420-11568_t